MHETCAHSSHLPQRNRRSEEDTTKKLYCDAHGDGREITCRRGFNSCKDGPHCHFHYRHHHLLFSVGRLSVHCNPMIRNWGLVIRALV